MREESEDAGGVFDELKSEKLRAQEHEHLDTSLRGTGRDGK